MNVRLVHFTFLAWAVALWCSGCFDPARDSPPRPPPPTEVWAEALSSHMIRLEWEGPSGTDAEVQRKVIGGSWVAIRSGHHSVLLDRDLFPDTEYTYRVRNTRIAEVQWVATASVRTYPFDFWIGDSLRVEVSPSAIAFWDLDVGVIVGSNGLIPAILRTIDGGRTWQEVWRGTGYASHLRLALGSNGLGFATGHNFLMITRDAGRSWSEAQIGFTTAFGGVALAGDSIVVSGGSGGIIRSTDQGRTWSRVPVPTASFIEDVDFADASRGVAWAAVYPGGPLLTSDGGASWSAASFPLSPGLDFVSRVGLLEGGAGFCLGSSFGRPKGLRTADYWASWSSVAGIGYGGVEEPMSFWLFDASTAVIAGFGFWATQDSCRTWSREPADVVDDVRDVFFFDRDHGIAIDAHGRLFRTRAQSGAEAGFRARKVTHSQKGAPGGCSSGAPR